MVLKVALMWAISQQYNPSTHLTRTSNSINNIFRNRISALVKSYAIVPLLPDLLPYGSRVFGNTTHQK